MQHYSQRDPRWSRNRLGNSSVTIGSHGCLLTCVSMITSTQPDEANRQITTRGFNSRGELLWYPAGEILGFEYLGWSSGRPMRYPVIAEVPAPAGSSYPTHFIVLIDGNTMIDPWDLSPRPRPRTYPIRSYRNLTTMSKSIDLTEAILIVSTAYQNVFGYPPSRQGSIHDARMIQRGERTQATLEQSYRTEIEQARQRGLGTSDRSAEGFNVMAYVANYEDIRKAFGIKKVSDARHQRTGLYTHYLHHGIKEQRTDTPLSTRK
jgi:hypothetical protein